jgi:hypothetical protein
MLSGKNTKTKFSLKVKIPTLVFGNFYLPDPTCCKTYLAQTKPQTFAVFRMLKKGNNP